MRRETNSRTETKDAILWQILEDERKCHVKIQGSNTEIIAYYPQNWQSVPSWCKPGNAVKIMHTGGNRGRIELVGHGAYIPSPVEGADPFPPMAVGEDCILFGCEVLAMTPVTLMMVRINAGSYRISGETYYLGAFGGETGPMALGSGMPLGTGYPLGEIGAYGIEIDAAPVASGHFRYDLIVVGIDGVVDYLKGDEFTDEISIPEIPADHLECGRILLYPGMTTVIQEWINRAWTIPEPSSLQISIADDELIWGSIGPPDTRELSTDIEVLVLDQYGNGLSPASGKWYLELDLETGNGTVDGDPPPVTKTTTGNHVHFTYARTYDGNDESPIIKATLINLDSPISAYGFIKLLDSDGELMF